MSRYLVDTNIFVYARGTDHAYREPCRAVLRGAREGSITLEASVEVVQEFADLLLRRSIDRSVALEEIEEVRSQCHLREFDVAVLEEAMGLLGRHPRLGVRDSVHAATALTAGIGRMLSTDTVFDDLEDLRRVDPADAGARWR